VRDNALTIVRITQIDGKLPNIALMKIAHHHRAKGDDVVFKRAEHFRRGNDNAVELGQDIFEPSYDKVYASAIFSFSADRVAQFRRQFPDAIIGGTYDLADHKTVEEALGIAEDSPLDYSIYPKFDASIGFTQRGCRLKCGFCVVPKKEGKNRSVRTINDIWRGDPWPKHLHLLDNDFFGQPREQWEARIEEIVSGDFKVCLNQGINVRMIDDASARAIGMIKHTNDTFDKKVVYTAWDNLGDEQRFFHGVDLLEKYGTPSSRLRVYMLIGYDKRETWERVFYRFDKMAEREIQPYPMIYGERHRSLPSETDDRRLTQLTLADFQRWVLRRMYPIKPFADYYKAAGHTHGYVARDQVDLFAERA
jgi:hypothetical protein